MTDFYRITFKKIGGGTRSVWADKLKRTASGDFFFRVLSRSGDWNGEYVLAAPSDIVDKRSARMNNKYCEFETTTR